MPLVPVFCQKSAAVRWSEEPVPEDANDTCCGFLLRYSMSSATLLGGKPGFATSALGVRTATVMRSKSRRGSYERSL